MADLRIRSVERHACDSSPRPQISGKGLTGLGRGRDAQFAVKGTR
jgi:hypothetical protein